MDDFPVTPAPDRLVLQPLSQDVTFTTNRGIELAATDVKRRTRWGVLKACGGKMGLTPASGEDEVFILYPTWSAMDFEYSGNNYAIVRVCDILGIVGLITEF